MSSYASQYPVTVRSFRSIASVNKAPNPGKRRRHRRGSVLTDEGQHIRVLFKAEAALTQAHKALLTNDQMIEQFDVKQGARRDQLPGDLHVLGGRRRIS